MQIDGTRTKAFWQNPEKYRINYQLNIVPAETPYWLHRGTAFHVSIDLGAKGWGPEEIDAVLHGLKPDDTGRLLTGLSEKAIENGKKLAAAYLRTPRPFKVLASEVEFDFSIPGSDHRGVGRIDQIIEDPNGIQHVLEFKTAKSGTDISKKRAEWLADRQADFELLGSKSLGFGPVDVQVQYVIDSDPPKIWQPLSVVRTEYQLKVFQLFLHQTCETIQMYKAAFGIEQPWPHIGNWPCTGQCEYCGVETVCNRAGKLTPEMLGPQFKTREEHLEILR